MGRSTQTRTKVLSACKEELETAGFTKFSMEGVAKRAGVNKNVVYRHVLSKEAAIQEAWKSVLQNRIQIQSGEPGTMSDAIKHWLDSNQKQQAFFRLLNEEALLGGTVILEEERRAYYAKQVEDLRRRGDFGSSMDFMVLLSIVSLPFALPHIFELVTGRKPDGDGLRQYLEAVLKSLNGGPPPSC
jgi:AcrR family transcriptional regulator